MPPIASGRPRFAVGVAVVTAALTLLTLALAGCKPAGSSRLEGRWRGTRADGVGPAVQDAANTFASQTEIVAHGDQLIISTAATKGQRSSYVVDSESKAGLVIHTEKDGVTNKETLSLSEDGRTMTWRVGEGRTITFQRLKE